MKKPEGLVSKAARSLQDKSEPMPVRQRQGDRKEGQRDPGTPSFAPFYSVQLGVGRAYEHGVAYNPGHVYKSSVNSLWEIPPRHT